MPLIKLNDNMAIDPNIIKSVKVVPITKDSTNLPEIAIGASWMVIVAPTGDMYSSFVMYYKDEMLAHDKLTELVNKVNDYVDYED